MRDRFEARARRTFAQARVLRVVVMAAFIAAGAIAIGTYWKSALVSKGIEDFG